MRIIFLILFSISLSFADDIVLKIEKSITNVQIIEEDHYNVKIKRSDGKEILIRKETIIKIIEIPFDPDKPSVLIEGEPELKNAGKILTMTKPDVPGKYPNLNLWPVSVVSFGLFIVLKTEAINIQDEIDDRRNSSPFISTAELEDKKKFNDILGLICLVGGIANTVYMFLPVEISATDNQVNLTYRF